MISVTRKLTFREFANSEDPDQSAFPHSQTRIYHVRYQVMSPVLVNSFSAKGNIQVFANNTDAGESARNELSRLKSVLFAF